MFVSLYVLALSNEVVSAAVVFLRVLVSWAVVVTFDSD